MIQRIQTLHLLIVATLIAVLFFPNFATVTLSGAQAGVTREVSADGSITRSTTLFEEGDIVFNLWGISQNGEKITPTTHLGVLVIITLALAVVTIFLYRKRWVQIRFCFSLAILLAGIEAFIIMYIYKLVSALKAMNVTYAVKYSVADLLPLLALVFVYLAFRGIAKDEALVRSLNRIR